MSDDIIYAVVDYNGLFGSRHNAVPYKSGMDKDELELAFRKLGWSLRYVRPIDIDYSEGWSGRIVIYTSQEDIGYVYKDYLFDKMFGLMLANARLVPGLESIWSNNNKHGMHILESLKLKDVADILPNDSFSTVEELEALELPGFPLVVKLAEGAMSQNVSLAQNYKQLLKFVNDNSFPIPIWEKIRESVRSFKYPGYTRQTNSKNKFVVQQYLPGLQADYKVLKFGRYFYIFKRPVRKGDFRASGSGQLNYLYGSDTDVPDGIFQLTEKIASAIDVPCISIDFALSDGELFIIEFQSLYFGTVGQHRSDIVYIKGPSGFTPQPNTFGLEEIYAEGIVSHIRGKEWALS